MRVMVLVKATAESEAGNMPSTELLEAMGKYNEELANAGILLAGEGLHPSVKGKRIAFDGPDRAIIDGPFAETRELVAGFWLWEVKDMAQAVEWVKRCPNPCPARARSRSAQCSKPPTSAKPRRRRLPSGTIASAKGRTPAEPPAVAAPLQPLPLCMATTEYPCHRDGPPDLLVKAGSVPEGHPAPQCTQGGKSTAQAIDWAASELEGFSLVVRFQRRAQPIV
jgi:hypothetical protein